MRGGKTNRAVVTCAVAVQDTRPGKETQFTLNYEHIGDVFVVLMMRKHPLDGTEAAAAIEALSACGGWQSSFELAMAAVSAARPKRSLSDILDLVEAVVCFSGDDVDRVKGSKAALSKQLQACPANFRGSMSLDTRRMKLSGETTYTKVAETGKEHIDELRLFAATTRIGSTVCMPLGSVRTLHSPDDCAAWGTIGAATLEALRRKCDT
jgi:hypothetical protein